MNIEHVRNDDCVSIQSISIMYNASRKCSETCIEIFKSLTHMHSLGVRHCHTHTHTHTAYGVTERLFGLI